MRQEECLASHLARLNQLHEVRKCRYSCHGEIIELLVLPADKCPGEGAPNNRIEWRRLKWLPIENIL